MTSMIDVVFLLLVFFIFAAKFVLPEEFLPSELPEDGLSSGDISKMAEIVVELEWDGEEAHAIAFVSGAFGAGSESAARFTSHYDRRVGYSGPDRQAVERYLADRAKSFGRETPVTIRFENGVPYQMVVDIFDSCERVGLDSVSVAAEEIEL